jgi:hypothetical protein
MRKAALPVAIVAACVALSASAPALARGSGGSKVTQHSDLTITKTTDKSSPKLMSAKPVKPNPKRVDPYRNYNFR